MSNNKTHWGIKKTILKDKEVIKRLKDLDEITFTFPSESPIEGNYSCFKIHIGRKFYIAKTKTCLWLPTHLNKLLKQYNMNGTNPNDIYFPIVKQIHNTGYYECPIEFICQSDDPYDVIKSEFLALQENKENKQCINRNDKPYVPKYNPKTRMFGWLTQNQFLNYCKVLKKYNVTL